MTRHGDWIWESREATTREDGTGCFALVGGYEVCVRDTAGRPVTGGTVIAESPDDLAAKVTAMLDSFSRRWNTSTEDDKQRAYRVAAITARRLGWATSIRP